MPILHHVTGIVEGLHVSSGAGQSQDFLDLVPYSIGDDVSMIDWKSSARQGYPIIKRFERHTLATMIIIVDCGQHMAALAAPWHDDEVERGAPQTSKDHIGIELLELFSYLALLRGDKVGIVAGHRGHITTHVARHGKEHIRRMSADVQRLMSPHSPPGDLAALVHRARIVTTRPSIMIVLTDTAVPKPQVLDELKKLTVKHWVAVGTILDANPATIPHADPTTQITPDVCRGNTPFQHFALDRHLVEEIAHTQRDTVQSMMAAYKQAKIHHIPLATQATLPNVLERSFAKGHCATYTGGGR